MSHPLLSILICTIPKRHAELTTLINMFTAQEDFTHGRWFTKTISRNRVSHFFYYGREAEIIVIRDERKMTIGKKRQMLLELAHGAFVVFFDDDDIPSDKYIPTILDAIKAHQDVDCLGIYGVMTTNGTNRQYWANRLGYEWRHDPNRVLGMYHYTRNITHFNPVRRTSALAAGFPDISFGEDKIYSDKLNKMLKKEFFIDEQLFHYKYNNTDTTKYLQQK